MKTPSPTTRTTGTAAATTTAVLSAITAILALAAAGCTAPAVKPRLHSDRAAERIPALVAQGAAGDEADFKALILALNDADPAVRLYAARALQQTTGQTFGYRYYQEAADRRPAVQRWRQWLAEHHGQTLPAEPAALASGESDSDTSVPDTSVPAPGTPSP